MSYPRPDARTHHRSGNTLGLRGTCSLGYILRATSTPEMVAGVPYSDISTHTMLPVSHVVWSSVWLGIADAAVEKARKYVRAAARKQPGVTSPGALRLAEVAASAQQFADLVGASARRYDRAVHAEEGVADFEATGAVGFSRRDEQPESHSVDSGGGNRGADNVDLWNLGISRGHRIFARSAPS